MPALRVLVAVCCFAPLALRADPIPADGSDTNHMVSLSAAADLRREAGPGISTAQRVYFQAGTNRIAFLLPNDLLPQASDAELQFESLDNTCVVKVRLLALPVAGATPKLEPAAARETVLQRHAQACNLTEMSSSVANSPAIILDFDTAPANESPARKRMVWVATQAGLLEFDCSATPDRFAHWEKRFRSLLLTVVVSDAQGKLEVAPLSELL